MSRPTSDLDDPVLAELNTWVSLQTDPRSLFATDADRAAYARFGALLAERRYAAARAALDAIGSPFSTCAPETVRILLAARGTVEQGDAPLAVEYARVSIERLDAELRALDASRASTERLRDRYARVVATWQERESLPTAGDEQ